MEDCIYKLILLYIPTSLCNFQCQYCFIGHTGGWKEDKGIFKYDIKQIINCLSVNRLGGVSLINLTAKGETLLYKDIVELTHGLLKMGHYVELVTNGSVTKRIEEILDFPEKYLKHLEFKISYHYEELKKKNLAGKFWQNVELIKNSPSSFTIEIMPHDSLVAYIPDICSECKKHVGAICHATVGRNDASKGKELLTDMTDEEYVKTWHVLDSEMFRHKMNLFGVKRKEFCYAGKWSLLVNLATGEAGQCYGRPYNQNIFENPEKPIKFFPVGYTCLQPFCFNGHAHVALGLLPEVLSPTYSEIRNRITDDGTSWLKEDCNKFFSQKLYENNPQYSKTKKLFITFITPFYLIKSLLYNRKDTRRKLFKYLKIRNGIFMWEK